MKLPRSARSLAVPLAGLIACGGSPSGVNIVWVGATGLRLDANTVRVSMSWGPPGEPAPIQAAIGGDPSGVIALIPNASTEVRDSEIVKLQSIHPEWFRPKENGDPGFEVMVTAYIHDTVKPCWLIWPLPTAAPTATATPTGTPRGGGGGGGHQTPTPGPQPTHTPRPPGPPVPPTGSCTPIDFTSQTWPTGRVQPGNQTAISFQVAGADRCQFSIPDLGFSIPNLSNVATVSTPQLFGSVDAFVKCTSACNPTGLTVQHTIIVGF